MEPKYSKNQGNLSDFNGHYQRGSGEAISSGWALKQEKCFCWDTELPNEAFKYFYICSNRPTQPFSVNGTRKTKVRLNDQLWEPSLKSYNLCSVKKRQPHWFLFVFHRIPKPTDINILWVHSKTGLAKHWPVGHIRSAGLSNPACQRLRDWPKCPNHVTIFDCMSCNACYTTRGLIHPISGRCHAHCHVSFVFPYAFPSGGDSIGTRSLKRQRSMC